MAHIELPSGKPGIAGLFDEFPEIGRHLNGFAQTVLRGPSSLTPAERETIAAFVSTRNECTFCAESHSAAARHLLGDAAEVVDIVRADHEDPAVDPKLRALLAIAAKVRVDGRTVTSEDIERARAEGADDKAIHDTVLITAAFCMFNRYVDGLGTWAPQEPQAYVDSGKQLAENGYGHA